MNTNCKIKITKFVTAFLLICFVSPTFANETTVDPERSQLRKDIATTIQKAGAFGKVTVFGQDRTNGWALIDFTAEDEKDHRVFFIAGDFECLSQITPDLSDVELLCLNGDDFVGLAIVAIKTASIQLTKVCFTPAFTAPGALPHLKLPAE